MREASGWARAGRSNRTDLILAILFAIAASLALWAWIFTISLINNHIRIISSNLGDLVT